MTTDGGGGYGLEKIPAGIGSGTFDPAGYGAFDAGGARLVEGDSPGPDIGGGLPGPTGDGDCTGAVGVDSDSEQGVESRGEMTGVPTEGPGM